MSKTPGAVALTDEDIHVILERMGEGLTLMQSCKKSKRAYANVVRRINATPELKYLHARCREEYVRAQVDRGHDIASNPRIEPSRARLMIDMIKWESARVLPKEFGDRVQQEVIITNNTTLSQRMQQARARAAAKAFAVQPPPEGETQSNAPYLPPLSPMPAMQLATNTTKSGSVKLSGARFAALNSAQVRLRAVESSV